MPAVVRGGRRQGATKGRGQGSRNAPATPGKVAAIGRLDLSPRAVLISIVAGVVVLGGVLATGARAERISNSVSNKFDSVTSGMGLKVKQVHVTGASPEAKAAIQLAVGVSADQPIVSLDLNAVRDRVQAVGWVKEARVVRLLPDTLIVDVKEHDRLAVWQTAGHAYVIDSGGKVIPGADAGRYPKLPLVVGKGADQTASEILPLLVQRPRLLGGRGVQIDAQGGQNVGRTGLGADGAVAVLGDLQPRARQHEGGGCRDIIGVLAVAAGAAGVDHLVKRMIQRQGGVAHGRGEGDDLVHRLAANAQGGDGGGDLGRGRLAAQAGGEEGVGFIRRQDAPIDQLAQQRLETIHGVRPLPVF